MSPQAVTAVARGEAVASVLAGSWRRDQPPLSFGADALALAAPLMLASGGASLGWWRIRDSDLASSDAGSQLREAYRLHTLQAALHIRTIEQAVACLRDRGIVPILVKGWAVARLYPEMGLRPFGDVDLCVPPGQFLHAKAALGPEFVGRVDLHDGFDKFERRPWARIADRSTTARIGNVEVRLLGFEDQLRLLCFHLLRHSARRPLWLCDVAVAVELRPADFDWDRCLSGSRRESDWIRCTVGLAHRLLGARVDDTPASERARHLPGWLVTTVLGRWGRRHGYLPNIGLFLTRPSLVVGEIARRVADPLQATIELRGPLNGVPRLPFQIAHTIWRGWCFLGAMSTHARDAMRAWREL